MLQRFHGSKVFVAKKPDTVLVRGCWATKTKKMPMDDMLHAAVGGHLLYAAVARANTTAQRTVNNVEAGPSNAQTGEGEPSNAQGGEGEPSNIHAGESGPNSNRPRQRESRGTHTMP